MEITLTFLLLVITIILLILVVLIVFEGKTNKKISNLLKEVAELKKELQHQKHCKIQTPINSDKKNITPLTKSALMHNNQPFKHIQTEEQRKEVSHTLKKINPNRGNLKNKTEKIMANKYVKEQFIAGNIISKIGVGVLVLGIMFFMKYAIDNDWINNVGRISIGVLSSITLLFLAHQLRNTYKSFSSVLLGGAFAILYFSFAFAFHQYKLFGVTTAFALMIFITAFAVIISLIYNRMELAMFSLLAGFSAPLFVNFGNENYLILFSYILILDAGMLFLAYYKKWLLLNLMAIIFSALFYASWLIRSFLFHETLPYLGAFLFGTIFYFIFFIIMVMNNIKAKRPFIPMELSLISSITIMYYSAGMAIVHLVNDDLKGIFTATIAIVNFIYLLVLYRNPKVDRNLVFLMMGLVIVFTSLVPPVELVGKSITLIWSFQIMLLLWLAQKVNVVVMRISSFTMTLALLTSVILDMRDIYVQTSVLHQQMQMFFNQGFITNMVVTIALAVNIVQLKREKNIYFIPFVKVKAMQGFLALAAALVFYFAFFFEIKYQIIQHTDYDGVVKILMGIFHYSFLLLAVIPALLKKTKPLQMVAAFVGIFAVLLYIFYYHYQVITVRNAFLMSNDVTESQYAKHYILLCIVLVINVISIRGWQIAFKAKPFISKIMLWGGVFTLVFLLSSELDHITVVNQYREGFLPSHIIHQTHKFHYTLLWGGLSLILVIIGMIIRNINLRSVALALLMVTVLKLFIFDMGSLDANSQVVAFVFMGIVSLIISFLYQSLGNALQNKVQTTDNK